MRISATEVRGGALFRRLLVKRPVVLPRSIPRPMLPAHRTPPQGPFQSFCLSHFKSSPVPLGGCSTLVIKWAEVFECLAFLNLLNVA